MTHRIVWAAGVLLLLGAGAIWLRGRTAPSADHVTIAPDPPSAVRSEPVVPAPPAPRREPIGEVPPIPSQRTAAVAQAEPRRDFPDEALVERLFTLPGPDAGAAERLVWEESPISEYVYPAGHPCQGLPTDTASVQALVDAALEAPLLESIPEVDRPQILLRGRKRSLPLNNPCKELHREDPESVQRFIACFRALPEDPAGRPVEIWLPAELSHPEATTPREHYTRLIEHRAAQFLAGPRCER